MSKTESAKFSVSVKTAIKHRLKKLAKIVGRSSSVLVTEAIDEYPLHVNETQVSGTKEVIASLDRGEAVSHEKVCTFGIVSTSNRSLRPSMI